MSAALASPFEADLPFRVEAAAFVLALRRHGISDLGVLRAMETIPRENFAPRRYADLSRQDVALPLPFGQTMTAPSVVATMLGALAVRPGLRVLEIGTGSGYVTALLGLLGASVRSVERHPVLADSARERLKQVGLESSAAVETGDALAGAGLSGRFDRILLNGAVPELPPGLPSHLVDGGRIVFGQSATDGSTRLATVSRGPGGAVSGVAGGVLRLSRLQAPPAAGRATEA